VQANSSRFDALVDVVDPSDHVVASMPRKSVLPSGANFRVVHAFVFNSSRELLLQRVAPGLRHELMWGSSVAGYVNAGESYDQAATRKIMDELRIQLSLKRVGKTAMVDGSSTKFITLFEGAHDGPLSPDPTQIAEMSFQSIPDVQAARRSGQRTFTPTFLFLLDQYLAGNLTP
jgi:isopentenyldiphosphate isomerase